MRWRDVGDLLGYGLFLLVITWGVTAMLVSSGWLLLPGAMVPIRVH